MRPSLALATVWRGRQYNPFQVPNSSDKSSTNGQNTTNERGAVLWNRTGTAARAESLRWPPGRPCGRPRHAGALREGNLPRNIAGAADVPRPARGPATWRRRRICVTNQGQAGKTQPVSVEVFSGTGRERTPARVPARAVQRAPRWAKARFAPRLPPCFFRNSPPAALPTPGATRPLNAARRPRRPP